jgi:hypothetical protein
MFSDVSRLDLGSMFWGEDHRSKVPFLSQYIQEYAVNMASHCWCNHLAEVLLARFL